MYCQKSYLSHITVLQCVWMLMYFATEAIHNINIFIIAIKWFFKNSKQKLTLLIHKLTWLENNCLLLNLLHWHCLIHCHKKCHSSKAPLIHQGHAFIAVFSLFNWHHTWYHQRDVCLLVRNCYQTKVIVQNMIAMLKSKIRTEFVTLVWQRVLVKK